MVHRESNREVVPAVPGITEQRCRVCGQTKPASEFYRSGKYLSHECKVCTRERIKISRTLRAGSWDGLREQREKFCPRCKRLLPIKEFYVHAYGRSQSICKECDKKVATEPNARLREDGMRNKRSVELRRETEAKARICPNCGYYPCFQGMENISSNLAETCKSWHLKKNQNNSLS